MENLDDILARVFRLNAEELENNLTIENIDHWDSLTHMDLISSIEEKLNLEFSIEEITSLTSIGKIRKIVQNKMDI